MSVLYEFIQCFAAHPLGRRIRPYLIGIVVFKIKKLFFQRVQCFIRDLLPVKDMVLVTVTVDKGYQFLDPSDRFLFCHTKILDFPPPAVNRLPQRIAPLKFRSRQSRLALDFDRPLGFFIFPFRPDANICIVRAA